MAPRLQEVVINCADPAHLAEFWGRMLGARRLGPAHLGPDGDGSVVLADPADNEFCFVVDNHGRWTAAARAALDAAGPR